MHLAPTPSEGGLSRARCRMDQHAIRPAGRGGLISSRIPHSVCMCSGTEGRAKTKWIVVGWGLTSEEMPRPRLNRLDRLKSAPGFRKSQGRGALLFPRARTDTVDVRAQETKDQRPKRESRPRDPHRSSNSTKRSRSIPTDTSPTSYILHLTRHLTITITPLPFITESRVLFISRGLPPAVTSYHNLRLSLVTPAPRPTRSSAVIVIRSPEDRP